MIVQGIILAAGLSRRMGLPKLLLELDGVPVIMWVVRAALRSALHDVTLIAGPETETLAGALEPVADHPRFHLLINPRPNRGMSSSLHIGVSSMSPHAAGTMILLGDQPGVTAELIDELLSAFGRDPKKIVFPAIAGRRTTPVVFPADLFPELMMTSGDVGGREVVDHNRPRVVPVEMGARYDDSDLDTPEDVEILQRKIRSKEVEKE